MEYEKVELLGLKDTLEHLLDFIWKMETSPPYFYGIFDRMKNNIELFLCVQAEDVEYLLEILDRDWKEANRKLIGIQYYDVRENNPSVDLEECFYLSGMIAEMSRFLNGMKERDGRKHCIRDGEKKERMRRMPSFLDDISSFYGTGEKNEKGQTLEEFLKEYDPYQYKNPCATTDMVLFSYAGEKPDTDALKVLLVCRKNHPSIGYWALPGGFVELYENLEDTARRELEEETGVKGLPVEQFACYGDYQRDPRARVITTAYFSLVNEKEVRVKAGDDAADAAWFTVKLKKGESKDITTDAAVIRREDFSLELENEDRGLKIRAVICKEERQGLVRERKYKVKEGGMVAVDHAAILTQALEVIQQRIRKNSCTCG